MSAAAPAVAGRRAGSGFARFAEVFRLELSHNLRRPLFWILLIIVGFLAQQLSSGHASIGSGDSGVGGTKAWITSEFAIAQLISIIVAICYGFFVSVAAGLAIVHDDDHKVGELLHATPLRPAEYVWGKFLAVLLTFFGVLAIHLALQAVFNHALPKGDRADILGPFAFAHYARPALVFGLPTMIFMAGTAFALGTLTRKPILVFLAPVAAIMAGAFFLWEWSPSWLDPRINWALQMIDPSGVRWLSQTWLHVDRGVAFYNHHAVPLDRGFVVMRFVWVAVGLAGVWLTQRRFEASLRGARATSRAKAAALATMGTAANGAAAGPRLPRPLATLGMRLVRPTFLAGALEVMRTEVRELASQPGLYLFVPIILLQAFGNVVSTTAFDTTLLATPGILAVRLLNTLTLLLCLLLLFYTVESLQRERSTGVASIGWSTPLRTGAILLGKALANAFVGFVVVLACLIGAGLVMLVQGKVPFSLGPFAIVWGLLLVPTLLAWTAFVMLAFAATSNRFTTYGLGLAALVVTGMLQTKHHMNWVGNWDLWSAVRWTDMGVFELDRTALVLNRIEILGLGLLFIAITARIFPRREPDAIRVMHRLRPAALRRAALGVAPFALVPIVAGGALFAAVQDGYQGAASQKLDKDYWAKNVMTWAHVPLPSLAGVDLDVTLEPAKRSYEVHGTYAITNPHAESLRQIPLSINRRWEHVTWTLDGKPVTPDDRSGLCVFTPAQPLRHGEQLRIGFGYRGSFPHGVSKNGGTQQQFVLPSGVVLTSFEAPSWVPYIGYVPGIGVEEDKNKAEPRSYPDSFYVGTTDPELAMGSGYFPTHIRVTGPADYTYNSTGVLVSDVTANGRRTEVWQSDHPVRIFNLCAGRWAVKRDGSTAVYYAPQHSYNVDEMLRTLVAARRYYSQWFCPYPWRDLKLSEFPALADYAQGSPTNITFAEGIGFLTKSEPKADAAFWITAHEAAHQWWGNIIMPADGPGSVILAEGMAHFSTMLLTDQVQGPAGGMAFRKFCEARYATGRRADAERPLTQVDESRNGDSRLIYERGGWVLWMMQDLMGREAALRGIQAFIREYRDTTDHPALQDYLREMRAYAPDPVAYDSLVSEWALGTALPEYKLADVHRATAPGGGWVVTATVRNDGTGRMPIEVAAASEDRLDGSGALVKGYLDARARIVLGPGESKAIAIRCAFPPKRLVVDPDVRVLQLRREKAQAWL